MATGLKDCKNPNCGGILVRDNDGTIECFLCSRPHDNNGKLIQETIVKEKERLNYAKRHGVRL